MKEILKYLSKYKWEAVLAPLFKMIEATFELLVPLIIAQMIDKAIANQNIILITKYALILLSFAIIGLICAIVAQYFSAKAATGFAKEIKNTVFEHIESLSFSELDQIGTATLITRMTSDINQMQTGVNMFLRLFLRSPFVVLGAIIMAFIVDIHTAIIFVVAVPILAIIIFSILLVSIPLFKKIQEKLDILLSRTRQNLKGIRVIRAFRQEQKEREDFNNENLVFTKFQLFASKISALLNPLTYVIVNLSIVLIIFLAAKEVDEGLILQGSVVAQYNYMSQILVELIKLANLVITLTKAIACSKRIAELLAIKTTQQFPEKNHLQLNNTEYAVEYQNVSFKFSGNQNNSIENISFRIKHKEIIGIIGGTGAGKTTLINLLPRFYDVVEGTILIDGNSVFNYSRQDLRKKIGVVLQKATLFNGTIRDNLTLSNPGQISDEQIWQALAIVQGQNIVTKKSEGLDTIVDQGGKNFSGGEAQRLSIARTILGNPEILILDDSFSALDYLTEKKVREAISALGITTIIVSQRCSSVMNADQIIVLDEGKIDAIGNHQLLMEKSLIYQEIYYSQNKEDGE